MKNIVITILLFVCIFLAPFTVHAEEQTCVTQYGGAVVCGAATPQFHAPVKTGVADINFTILGTLLIGSSAILYFKSRKSAAH